ncbi:TonB-dependent receptor plug domain-containing protein, partial [Arsukibacterium sp.]|uniref:TonB-dependent receptor plug domain-containing protein n=1 Tax=Arsukibacterium sp. TaxID=1977258 RepID=UPI002FD8F86E
MQRAKLPLLITLLLGSTHYQVLASTEQDTDQLERITITGSRLKQVDMEGASPITVINAADVIAAGFNNVGDALRASNFNSFGSWGGGANNSWASQSTVSMKGSGSERTLVLLDGQRMAKSPVMDGGSANLNTLPMAAVERIEVLSDGASAIYGTDAMAGVINIILKKDYNGSQV